MERAWCGLCTATGTGAFEWISGNPNAGTCLEYNDFGGFVEGRPRKLLLDCQPRWTEGWRQKEDDGTVEW